MKGGHTAYYLIHSMGSIEAFEEQDRRAAETFARIARESGVQQIIYLGGLGDSSLTLSPHLKSRQEVGHLLRESGVQVIEFRASIVIGSGSLSFEMVRALVGATAGHGHPEVGHHSCPTHRYPRISFSTSWPL